MLIQVCTSYIKLESYLVLGSYTIDDMTNQKNHEVIGLNNHGCMHIMFLTIIDDMTNQKNHEGIGLNNHRFYAQVFASINIPYEMFLIQLHLTCRKDRIHNRLQAKKNEDLF